MTVDTDAASLEPGALVELFDLDLIEFGGGVERFIDGESPTAASGQVMWRGNPYYPRAIRAEGLEVNVDGKPPRPTLSVSNIGNLIGLLISQYEDIVGARVTRWRTFEQYLDGQPQADPDQHFPVDVFIVNRKTSQTSEVVSFELSNPFDQTSKMLPGRIVQKRYCPWRYRVYDNGFSYEDVECPYVGTSYFTTTGAATSDPRKDQCGKRLSDCKLRFAGVFLPYGGFPGVRRFG